MVYITISKLNKGMIQNNDDNSISQYYTRMNSFVYFGEASGGNLLHKATKFKLEFYCQLLLNEGFDCKEKSKRDESAYDIANKYRYSSIISKFDEYEARKNVCEISTNIIRSVPFLSCATSMHAPFQKHKNTNNNK